MLLLNRTTSRAEGLAEAMDGGGRVRVAPLAESGCVREAGLVINATSIGMEPGAGVSPLGDGSVLHDGMVVLDIVYKPLRTQLLEQALAAGARALDGLGMLVHQGARAFEIWTGVRPPVDVMRRAIEPVKGAA